MSSDTGRENKRTSIDGRRFLVTGAAGFIGFHVAKRLCDDGGLVLGIDNLNDYYDVELKENRLKELEPRKRFEFTKMDITRCDELSGLFSPSGFDMVIHLAAQAGVRYSVENPQTYVDTNIKGFLNIIEECRKKDITNLIYASSSSVYGENEKKPFEEDDLLEKPVSLYAISKIANEIMASSYSRLHGISGVGLRFFSVYGPWGRPDMALFKFTKNILEGKPIQVYNHGKHVRSFTYIDDVVESMSRLIQLTFGGKMEKNHTIYNIGGQRSISLMSYIEEIEKALGKKAEIEFLPMQPGDVERSEAKSEKLSRAIGFVPGTDLVEGIRRFTEWYRSYYR